MTDNIECEANLFALFILMPEDLILPELRKGFDMSSDDDIKRICKKFGVSPTALAARIDLLLRKYPKGLPLK